MSKNWLSLVALVVAVVSIDAVAHPPPANVWKSGDPTDPVYLKLLDEALLISGSPDDDKPGSRGLDEVSYAQFADTTEYEMEYENVIGQACQVTFSQKTNVNVGFPFLYDIKTDCHYVIP